jgi:heme-degrading monooxygenase HmoA
MTQRLRVLVYANASEADSARVDNAYRHISSQLTGTPGLLGNELLKNPDDPCSYIVMSEWESLDAFRRWEHGPNHRDVTSPLRPFVRGADVYEVSSWWY